MTSNSPDSLASSFASISFSELSPSPSSAFNARPRPRGISREPSVASVTVEDSTDDEFIILHRSAPLLPRVPGSHHGPRLSLDGSTIIVDPEETDDEDEDAVEGMVGIGLAAPPTPRQSLSPPAGTGGRGRAAASSDGEPFAGGFPLASRQPHNRSSSSSARTRSRQQRRARAKARMSARELGESPAPSEEGHDDEDEDDSALSAGGSVASGLQRQDQHQQIARSPSSPSRTRRRRRRRARARAREAPTSLSEHGGSQGSPHSDNGNDSDDDDSSSRGGSTAEPHEHDQTCLSVRTGCRSHQRRRALARRVARERSVSISESTGSELSRSSAGSSLAVTTSSEGGRSNASIGQGEAEDDDEEIVSQLDGSLWSNDYVAASINSFVRGEPKFMAGGDQSKLRLWQSLCVELGLCSLPDSSSSYASSSRRSSPSPSNLSSDGHRGRHHSPPPHCSRDRSATPTPSHRSLVPTQENLPFPTSLTQAKTILKNHAFVNIKEYLAIRAELGEENGTQINRERIRRDILELRLPSRSALKKDVKGGRRVNLSRAKEAWLQPLLQPIWFEH